MAPIVPATPLTLYGAAASGSIAVEPTLTLLGIPFTLVESATWAEPAARERVAPQNALRQVPTLVLPGGEVMTESAAILMHLADVHPAARLAPPVQDEPRRRQYLRWMAYVSSAIYALHWIKPDVRRIGAPLELRDSVVDAVQTPRPPLHFSARVRANGRLKLCRPPRLWSPGQADHGWRRSVSWEGSQVRSKAPLQVCWHFLGSYAAMGAEE